MQRQDFSVYSFYRIVQFYIDLRRVKIASALLKCRYQHSQSKIQH